MLLLPVVEQNSSPPIDISITSFSPVVSGDPPTTVFSYSATIPGDITYTSATQFLSFVTACEPELTYSWDMDDGSALLPGAFVDYTHSAGTYNVEVTITGGPYGPIIRTCEVTV